MGFVGILRPWHGLDLLLEATRRLAARFPTLHLLVVGDGPMETELRRVAESSGMIRRVTFTGRLAHGDVRDCVAAMDITVSPKATFYASPMKILEYMAVAKPVVAPAMDNIRDIIDDGRTGLLFTPDDPDDLTRTLEALLTSGERRRGLGMAARQEIEGRLNWHSNARTVLARIDTLLRHRDTAGTTAQR